MFQPYIAPDEVAGSTLLRELLRRRCLHTYRDFCQAYDIAAAAIDTALVGSHPAQQQFHRWICGEMPGLPHPGHCTVLEAMFPGYSARELFEITEPAEPPSRVESVEPAAAASASGNPPELSGAAGWELPDQALMTLTGLALPDHVAVALLQHLEFLTSSLATLGERDRAYHQLVQVLRRWALTVDRRNALRLLGWAATAASAAGALDSDEYERVASVLSGQSRIDAATVGHIEAVLWSCDRQDHALGPHSVLDTVLAQRQLARSLLPDCPAELRPRLLSVLSEASRLAGWLSFDLNQFDNAGYYYEDARVRAHEAHNAQRGALVLCEMSYLATWRGMARTGIDHAVAAGQWATRTDDAGLRALSFDVAAQAYAADGQRDTCLTTLDAAHAALPAVGDDPAASVVSWPDEATHISIRGGCHLALHDFQCAIDYSQQSLATLDPSAVRNVAFTRLELGTAYAQLKEIDEATRLLGDAGEIAAANSSARLTERLHQARAELQPWQHTSAVRELDDRLISFGLA